MEYLLIIAVVTAGVTVAVNGIREYMRNNAKVSMHSDPGSYWDDWKVKAEEE